MKLFFNIKLFVATLSANNVMPVKNVVLGVTTVILIIIIEICHQIMCISYKQLAMLGDMIVSL